MTRAEDEQPGWYAEGRRWAKEWQQRMDVRRQAMTPAQHAERRRTHVMLTFLGILQRSDRYPRTVLQWTEQRLRKLWAQGMAVAGTSPSAQERFDLEYIAAEAERLAGIRLPK